MSAESAVADVDPVTQQEEQTSPGENIAVQDFKAPTPVLEAEPTNIKDATSEVITTGQPIQTTPEADEQGTPATVLEVLSAQDTPPAEDVPPAENAPPGKDAPPKPKTNYFKKAVGKYMLVSIATRGHQMVSMKKAAEEEEAADSQMVNLKPKSQLERAIAVDHQAVMKVLQKFYRAEEQHIRKTMSAYSSLKKHLGYVQSNFSEEMKRTRKYRPRKQFEYEYNLQMPDIIFNYDGVSRPATESQSRPGTQRNSRGSSRKTTSGGGARGKSPRALNKGEEVLIKIEEEQ